MGTPRSHDHHRALGIGEDERRGTESARRLTVDAVFVWFVSDELSTGRVETVAWSPTFVDGLLVELVHSRE